jgi:hypothetical protein
MSDDAQVMMTGLFPQTPAPSYPHTPTFPPGTYQYPESPFPNTIPPSSDYSKVFSAIAKAGTGIGAAGRDIGAYRSEKAMGEIAKENAEKDAFRIANKGLKIASAARAVTGAQGTTGAGSPLLAELESIQAAQTEALQRLYEGNIEKFYADQRAKKHLYKAPGDLLEGLLPGAELFKEKY